jgi:hypothetical protein
MLCFNFSDLFTGRKRDNRHSQADAEHFFNGRNGSFVGHQPRSVTNLKSHTEAVLQCIGADGFKLRGGAQIEGSYTWGKTIDTSSGSLVGDEYSNSIASPLFFAPRINRGLADFKVSMFRIWLTVQVAVRRSIPAIRTTTSKLNASQCRIRSLFVATWDATL